MVKTDFWHLVAAIVVAHLITGVIVAAAFNVFMSSSLASNDEAKSFQECMAKPGARYAVCEDSFGAP